VLFLFVSMMSNPIRRMMGRVSEKLLLKRIAFPLLH
jgi:hypothetical protein